MDRYFTQNEDPKIFPILRDLALLLIAITVVFGSFGTIGVGERGVKTRLGAMIGVVDSGLYFKFPLVDHVKTMDVHTQSLVATKEEPMSAASNDLQDTKLAVVVNYHIDPSMVADVYRQYGDMNVYYSTVVEPLIVGTVKAVASQYTAAEQIQKRQEMSAKALETLQKAFEGKNVIIEKADITDVAFSASFTQAIEAKVTAVQQAEAAKNKLAQIQYEAQQTVATAQAQAEAIKIQAAAINSSGGPDYVALQKVTKWDGHTCTSYCGLETMTNLLNTK